MSGPDLYAALGVAPEATSQQIRAAYQHLIEEAEAGKLPPEQRHAVEAAFEVLGDPIRRLRYDAQSAAPPSPRMTMPAIGLPHRKVKIALPILHRPNLPHVEPLPAIAVILVAAVAAFVVLTPILRHGSKKSPPPQSVSDLVKTPTAAAAVATAALPSATSHAPSFTPPLATPTQGLAIAVPSVQPGSPSAASEPPFITQQLTTDALHAVVAAAAVRNGPVQGSLPAASTGATTAAANAGVPITSPPPASVSAANAALPSTVAAPIPGSTSNAAANPVPLTSPLTGAAAAPVVAANPAPARTAAPLPPELSTTTTGGPQTEVSSIVRSVEANSAGSAAPVSTAATATVRTAPNHIGVPTAALAAGQSRSNISAGGVLPASAGQATPNASPAPNRFVAPQATP